MAMEIEVHKSLDHKHVVKFIGFFEDKDSIYVLLELCRRRVSVIPVLTLKSKSIIVHLYIHVRLCAVYSR